MFGVFIILELFGSLFSQRFLAKPVTSKALSYVAAMSSFGEAAKACIKVIGFAMTKVRSIVFGKFAFAHGQHTQAWLVPTSRFGTWNFLGTQDM